MCAVESMYCIEHCAVHDPSLAALSKKIPELLCKDDSIQKDVAKTAGLIMFTRMTFAMLGAIRLVAPSIHGVGNRSC